MQNITLFLIFPTLLILSCNNHPTQNKLQLKSAIPKTNKLVIGAPIVAEAEITKSTAKFWEYYYKNIELHEDFTAFDYNGKLISKLQFLQELKTGLYFPLALYAKDNNLNYKLAKIPQQANSLIGGYMKQFGVEQLTFYKMLGAPIPKFNFIDINGKSYASENTKGKIVLLKCWFLTCHACIEEIPALNKMVDKYKNRNDILFIGLVMENKKELQNFLSERKFDYAAVPDQTTYMSDKLHVTAYPTHFLINKKGNLVRVLPDEKQVAEALEKEIAK